MALHVPRAPGMAQMLKEGSRVSCGEKNHAKTHVVSNLNVCVGDFCFSISQA